MIKSADFVGESRMGVEVKVKNVIKVYKTADLEVVALRGLHMKVDPGEVCAIMGPSGSGKTTLLNLISGIDFPTAGSIIVDGEDITRLSPRELERYRLYKVGYIFQFFNLIPSLTAYENIELPLIMAKVDKNQRKKRVEELLELLDLSERAHHKPDELSGGERQRVAIACALANDPPLILADEPTGEVDTKAATKIVNILVSLSNELEKTVIISTHDPKVARRTNRILMIEDGVIKGEYMPAQLEITFSTSTPKSFENVYVKTLMERKAQIERELKILEESFRRRKISAEEFIKKYTNAKSSLDIIKEELAKHGVIIET